MFGEEFQKDTVENIFNVFGICNGVFEPQLTASDLGISYRTINNWEANDLMLSERINKSGWRKFTFVDYVWLNIVLELRNLGFPLPKILKLKDFLNEAIDDDSIFAVKRMEARVFHKDDNLNRLILLLAEIIANKNHIALLCNKEGEFYVYNEQLVRDEKSEFDITQFQFSNFVSVSLTDIIIKYLTNAKLASIKKTKIIDSPFIGLLEELRNEERDQLVFLLESGEHMELDASMFSNYDEFVTAAIRMLLTFKLGDVCY